MANKNSNLLISLMRAVVIVSVSIFMVMGVTTLLVSAFLSGIYGPDQNGGTITAAMAWASVITMIVFVILGLAWGIPKAVERFSIASNAGANQMMQRMTDAMIESNKMTQASIQTLMRVAERQASQAPRIAPTTTAQPMLALAGGQTADAWVAPAPQPPKQVTARVVMSDGKIVSHPVNLIDAFVKMPRPRREFWPHGNDSYTATAEVLCNMQNGPLERAGNGYRWVIEHGEITSWWASATVQPERPK